jgi:hypothetical protein
MVMQRTKDNDILFLCLHLPVAVTCWNLFCSILWHYPIPREFAPFAPSIVPTDPDSGGPLFSVSFSDAILDSSSMTLSAMIRVPIQWCSPLAQRSQKNSGRVHVRLVEPLGSITSFFSLPFLGPPLSLTLSLAPITLSSLENLPRMLSVKPRTFRPLPAPDMHLLLPLPLA